MNKDKIFLIITKWTFPFGGGEDFMKQTCKLFTEYKIIWISFENVVSGPHMELKCTQYATYTELLLPKKNNEIQNIVKRWLLLLDPAIVHTQGPWASVIAKVCFELNVPVLIGYHFWTDLIDLDPSAKNIQITKNISKHILSSEFKFLLTLPGVHIYFCSNFMREVVEMLCPFALKMPVVMPLSDKKANIPSLSCRLFVTHINIHKLKGGEIVLYLLKHTLLPYICVRTEPCSEKLDKEIEQQITINGRSQYISQRVNVVSLYEKTRIILIPSIVDETFCRVAHEALLNRLPVITTGNGNIRRLLGDAAIYVDSSDLDIWVKEVVSLYDDANRIEQLAKECDVQLMRLEKYSLDSTLYSIVSAVANAKKNVMIIAPFCDQGLGIQTRTYVNALLGEYNVFIFSYSMYAGFAKNFQKDENEWMINDVNVYYSTNNREQITDDEISEFVHKYRINYAIIPETCWFRIFEICRLLNSLNVKTIAVPNIEIVRKDEIHKHRYFKAIICHNNLCYRKFSSFMFRNIYKLQYCLPETSSSPKKYGDSVRFLLIGGLNAFSRKQAVEVCEAFSNACSNSILTLTIQGNFKNIIDKYKLNSRINIIEKHLSYNEILNLYITHDVSIQVSKKEGLGLGFYEAQGHKTPILTLDTEPHNEIVQYGWKVKCTYEKMKDNPQALIDDAVFDTNDMTNMIDHICSSKEYIEYHNSLMTVSQSHQFNVFKDQLSKIISTI